MDDLKSKIVKRIKELYSQKGIQSVNHLAAISGLTQSTLSSIMDGKSHFPRISTLSKICNGLGVTLSEFFDHPDFIIEDD
jgi:transcriptional regulator with XRE-family HTH domain